MKIEHVALYVHDLEKAKEFFVTYLNGKANDGYHNPNTDFRSYFISFEDGARLELMTRPELIEQKKSPYRTPDTTKNSSNKELIEQKKSPYRTGYAHVAFSVGSKAAVDELTAKLDEARYSVSSGPRTTGDGYYESCIVAFEENFIEITE